MKRTNKQQIENLEKILKTTLVLQIGTVTLFTVLFTSMVFSQSNVFDEIYDNQQGLVYSNGILQMQIDEIIMSNEAIALASIGYGNITVKRTQDGALVVEVQLPDELNISHLPLIEEQEQQTAEAKL